MNIVARLVDRKPVWLMDKRLLRDKLVTLIADEIYGPFDSIAQIEEWTKAPWVSIDSPH